MTIPVRQLVAAVFRLRCPVCLEGPVFHDRFNAFGKCDHCGFYFSRESGFWAGSTYFGYGATIFLVGTVGFTLGFVLGLGWNTTVLVAIIVVAIAFPLWFFRYSRVIWLALDLYLNPPVTEDFESRGRETGSAGRSSRS
jgi:uncharacterized protein (DUF983 family)